LTSSSRVIASVSIETGRYRLLEEQFSRREKHERDAAQKMSNVLQSAVKCVEARIL